MYSKKTMKSALESMMFVWGEELSARDAAEILEIEKKDAVELFRELQEEYEQEGRGIRIREIDGSYQFVTFVENEMFIEKLCTPVKIKRLSQAAFEVLAIIAYRQPVTRGEIDSIRGIKSDRVLDGLTDKGLIEVCGRSEGVGRPLLYRTTDEFLKKFGYTSLKELPDISDFDDMGPRDEDGVPLHEQLELDFRSDGIEASDSVAAVENGQAVDLSDEDADRGADDEDK